MVKLVEMSRFDLERFKSKVQIK